MVSASLALPSLRSIAINVIPAILQLHTGDKFNVKYASLGDVCSFGHARYESHHLTATVTINPQVCDQVVPEHPQPSRSHYCFLAKPQAETYRGFPALAGVN